MQDFDHVVLCVPALFDLAPLGVFLGLNLLATVDKGILKD